ncbi:MAG: hypothetical protein FWC27_03235 [Firmicutes bacterium]|nr:hypothetical protein [Bacillota bacterium]
MTDEKRTVCGYEVQFAMHIGPREVLLLLDPKSMETPYMVGYCGLNGLGLEQLFEVLGSDDYLEMVDEFLYRAQIQADITRTERDKIPEPLKVLGQEYCLPSFSAAENLNGHVVVMKPEVLRPEHRNAARQIVYVTGGFGAAANARGSAVYGYDVYSGVKSNWRRPDVLGILDPEKAPDWVKPGVEAIRAQLKEKGGKPHER